LKPAVLFILGLLIGWIIEWIIDWLYWRRRYAALQQENRDLKNQIAALETAQKKKPSPQKPRKDDLKRIKGIGPVISKKLNNAGITTFEQLSKVKPHQLEVLLGELIKRLADEDSIIAQAAKLDKKKKQRAKRAAGRASK